MLSDRTEREYRWYERRWQGDGQPEPKRWVEHFPGSHQRRNARAALVSWYRVELGRTLHIDVQPSARKVPEAFTEAELQRVLDAARATHRRAAPSLEFLYATGARVSEATGVFLEDVTATHVIQEVVGVLSPRTEMDYRQVVERWSRDGQPDLATWVSERSSEATRRNARAALIWHFRVNLGRTLDIPWVRPLQRPVPSAFSVPGMERCVRGRLDDDRAAADTRNPRVAAATLIC